jgi:transposase
MLLPFCLGSEELNVLKSHLRITIETLLARGMSQHEIARRTGVDRKTVRRYQAKSPMATGSGPDDRENPPPRPPARPLQQASSACTPQRAWIEEQVGLGRNAQAIYQDLVERFGFTHRYNSVKRFVRGLKARDPARYDVLESLPGEEAQVDFGQGALTLQANGKYRRPQLFVMTLKYSGKSFRKVVWKADQETWARLHEEAFRTFGGAVAYVVLDNLKQGVIRPDLYEPELNAVYAALLAHYDVVADPCRVGDPNRKGTVENAIQHTQNTALKGRRFDAIEAQNDWLAHWEERWAAPRIHGRKKRQVLAMFAEEQPYLKPLPAERFRCFQQATRTVDDAGLVQVHGAYYAALPAPLHSAVTVRIYAHEIEVLDDLGQVLRRHPKVAKGQYVLPNADRLFNPSRETARLLARVHQIGPHSAALALAIFSRRGRPGQRAIYGLANLARQHARADIEAACAQVLTLSAPSYQAVKRLLQRRAAATATANGAAVIQAGPGIRPIADYQTFFEQHAETAAVPTPPTARNPHEHVTD